MVRLVNLAGGLLLIVLVSACGTTARTTPPADVAIDTTAADTSARARPEVPRSITVEQRAPAGVNLDTVRAGRFDQGKMWTFDYPPIEYFAETYGFNPDEEWFEWARLATLRIPGCTASFVSPNGLVLTNHHCGRSHATNVSREGENILDNGFYAESLREERHVPGMWADQLVEIRDVTDEIAAAIAAAETDAERAQARADAIGTIEERLQRERGDGHIVQVIAYYSGALYSAYIFRRYTDLRLVMIPELAVGFFGGDPDNFTYPRYTVDFALFRVYENGEPLETQYYFPVSDEGVQAEDPVFVIGNPGSTFRLSTMSELTFRRDVEEPAVLRLIEDRVDALRGQLEEAQRAGSPDEEVDALRNQIFSLENAMKVYRGRVRALNDPIIFARRRDAERQFREAIEADPQLREEYGGLIEEMEDIQRQRSELASEFRAFLSLSPQASLGSAVLRRAFIVERFLRAQGLNQAMLDQALEALDAIQDQPVGLQEAYLAQRFKWIVESFGQNSPIVRAVLRGQEPEEAARYVVQGSQLTTAESARLALENGTIEETDPAVQVATALQERYANYQSAMAGLMARQEQISEQLGRARYAVYGTDVPPDATFSLRIADGVVRGYPYNGTVAPPYTTLYGVYDHYYSYGPGTAWDLPDSWLPPPPNLKLETPINFASTNDTIGGNSGSPVVNTDLQFVGVLFDGNIESLSGDFIYSTERSRSISVDARGILQALSAVYGADRLVEEATNGRLFESEAEADAALMD